MCIFFLFVSCFASTPHLHLHWLGVCPSVCLPLILDKMPLEKFALSPVLVSIYHIDVASFMSMPVSQYNITLQWLSLCALMNGLAHVCIVLLLSGLWTLDLLEEWRRLLG
jgi:hypothetical protein